MRCCVGRVLLCLFVATVSAVLLAADDSESAANIRGWGRSSDPAGQAKFELDGSALTITAPGAYRDLWPIKGEVNAPRVLEDAVGDFTVEVKVADVETAQPDSKLPGLASRVSFHAGTLLIWQDDRNFVRLDRTNMNRDGKAITSCYLHIFKDGQRTAELAPVVEDRPTHLRLERRGKRLMAAYSQDDGANWRSFPAQQIALPDKVKVGVAALNNTNQPCKAQFEGLKITKVAQ